MMTLGFVYPQYWLNPAIVKGSFLLHLSVIKSTFGVVHRIAKGIMFLPLLDSGYAWCAILILQVHYDPQCKGIMTKQCDLSLIFRLWKKIHFVIILIEKLIKLAKIAMLQVLESIEYERTFSNLSFMKNKLQNQLIVHLDLCVKMFSHNFFILLNFHYDEAIALWKEVVMKYK